MSSSQSYRGGHAIIGGLLSHQDSGLTVGIKAAALGIFSRLPADSEPCRSGLLNQMDLGSDPVPATPRLRDLRKIPPLLSRLIGLLSESHEIKHVKRGLIILVADVE